MTESKAIAASSNADMPNSHPGANVSKGLEEYISLKKSLGLKFIFIPAVKTRQFQSLSSSFHPRIRASAVAFSAPSLSPFATKMRERLTLAVKSSGAITKAFSQAV